MSIGPGGQIRRYCDGVREPGAEPPCNRSPSGSARGLVLELGFGPGYAIKTLASLAAHGCVLGIDASPEMLAQATRLNARAIRQGQVKLRLGDFGHLPWPTNTIDKILPLT